jgi:hypothetical protein
LLKQDIANTTLASQGLANLLNRFRYLYLKTDKENFSSINAVNFRDRLEALSKMQDNLGVYPLGLEEDIIQIQTNLNGFDENIAIFYKIISSRTGIPLTKLLGESAKGLNATGEGDRLNFYDRIREIQNGLIKDNLLKIYSIINAIITNKYEAFEDYAFNPLEEANEREKTEIGKAYIEMAEKMIEIGANQEQVFDWLKSSKTLNLGSIEFDKDTDGLLDYEEETNENKEEKEKNKKDGKEREIKNKAANNEFKEIDHPRDKDGKFTDGMKGEDS